VTPTTTAVKRAFNFNAGPAALPLAVLERMQAEMLDYRGTGMSVMEMSHRSAEFEAINDKAEKDLRRLLGIPEEYAVLFLQGGASLQFAMVPMNLGVAGKHVDMVHTGAWTAKAIEELKKLGECRMAGSSEANKFTRIPCKDELSFSPDASYVHICTNNTIEGTQWTKIPTTGAVPLIADMSSDIASRPIDVKQYGLIFAGAQKNLGPSSVTLVIVHKDLADKGSDKIAKILQYRTHIKEKSLYNTPPTFGIYALGLVLEWVESQGGVSGVEKINTAKAAKLYDAMQASGGYYSCPVDPASRSKMNVVFRVAKGDEAVEKKFAKEAEVAGLIGVKGHRSVGGMRASIYNAVGIEAVDALVSFMKNFQKANG
jgi:phosphoserine aminotransferase